MWVGRERRAPCEVRWLTSVVVLRIVRHAVLHCVLVRCAGSVGLTPTRASPSTCSRHPNHADTRMLSPRPFHRRRPPVELPVRYSRNPARNRSGDGEMRKSAGVSVGAPFWRAFDVAPGGTVRSAARRLPLDRRARQNGDQSLVGLVKADEITAKMAQTITPGAICPVRKSSVILCSKWSALRQRRSTAPEFMPRCHGATNIWRGLFALRAGNG